MNDPKQQKIAEAEMQKLLAHKGKKMIIEWINWNKPVKYICILKDVKPYRYIEIKNIQGTNLSGINAFIGRGMGITRISDEETNDVLYENSSLNFVNNSIDEINKLKEKKYGTSEYNLRT